MKYINAEKLKVEVKRLQGCAKAYLYGSERQSELSPTQYRMEGAESFCLSILSFIESLQQEQPSLPSNLDEVAKQLYPIITEEAKSDEWKIANREYNDMCIKLQDAFRKGAEWMARQIKQEQPECIEKTARISPGLISNFGTSTYVLDVDLNQDERAKVAPLGFNSGKIKIKIVCE